MKKGFTLVELVIVIAIVIVLSVVSVPIYRSYVDKAKWAEAYALLGTILSAQKAYYSEYGNFFRWIGSNGDQTCNDPVLGIDARGNKYFTWFHASGAGEGGFLSRGFYGGVRIPKDLKDSGTDSSYKWFYLEYNITKGSKYSDTDSRDSSWI